MCGDERATAGARPHTSSGRTENAAYRARVAGEERRIAPTSKATYSQSSLLPVCVVGLGDSPAEEVGVKLRMPSVERLASESCDAVDLAGNLPLVTGPCFVGQFVGLVRYRVRRLQRGL